MRALYKISIYTNAPIITTKAKARYAVNSIRGAVIAACIEAGLSGKEMELINFKPKDKREAPTILYGHPIANRNAFDIYGRGIEGHDLIQKIAEALKKKKIISLFYKENTFMRYEENIDLLIEGFSNIVIEPYLPLIGKIQSYYLATPAIFYDKDREHNEWNAISQKYWQKNDKLYGEEMRRSINNLVKSNLQYQVKYVVSDEGENLDPILRQIDQMEMNITDFHFKIDRYHRDQNMTPMLFMHFKTNIEMPRFIGHHSGRGFGLVALDNRGGGE